MRPYLLLASVLVLAACNQNDKGSDYERASAALTDSTSLYRNVDEAKLIKTADLDLKTKNVEESSRRIGKYCENLGGMVFHRELSNNTLEYKPVTISKDSVMNVSSIQPLIEMELRVPVQSLSVLIDSLEKEGLTEHSRYHVEDASLRYQVARLKQEVTGEAIITNHKPTSVETLVKVKQQGIDEYAAAEQIDADAHYSTVSVTLTQPAIVSKVVVANTNLSGYREPFMHRFGNALSAGWQGFLEIILVITSFWFIILPAIGIWIWYRKSFRPTQK